ncbi:hypothetical protein P2L43_10150, partial [Mannheimia haemolytica]|nr:hypothetical protein [Mannheimia haemolytica]MDW1027737.1 hypothetical protein [Mannheimia haemolytica]
MENLKLLTHPWAEKGLKNEIPLNREGSGVTSATATYEDGFPDVTMKPIHEGGKAPSGKDMNGVLYELSTHIVHLNKGCLYPFEMDFCNAIGGYPKGSLLISNDKGKLFISLIDNNTTDFNSENYFGKWDCISTQDLLNSPDGFKFIGQCESIAQLRTIEPTEDQQRILVKSYYAGKNLGGGEFYADFADTTTADNAGTVIVTAGGKRWKRVYSTLNIFDFGVSLDSVNNDAIKRLQAWQEPVLGLGNVIPASSRIVPASHISQVAYRFNGIDYLSEDYYKADLS